MWTKTLSKLYNIEERAKLSLKILEFIKSNTDNNDDNNPLSERELLIASPTSKDRRFSQTLRSSGKANSKQRTRCPSG